MTQHDQLRAERATRFLATDYADQELRLAALREVVAGLQSTDDPALVPLWLEMSKRYADLKHEIQESKTWCYTI